MKFLRSAILALPILLLLLAAGWWLVSTRDAGPEKLETDETETTLDPGSFAEFQPLQPAVSNMEDAPVPLPEPAEGAIPGEYTLTFSDSESMQAFLEDAEAAGLSILGAIPDFLAIRVSGPPSALKSLLKQGMEVDNNYLMEAPFMPDERFYSSSSLAAFGNGILEYLGIPNTPEHLKWGTGVTIAILDTGLQGHSALGDRQIQMIDLVNSSEEGEYTGHGTAVAGMIGSINAFAPGIAPGADLISVQVLNGAGQGDAFTLAEGILAAVQSGADIINMSLGGYGNSLVLEQAVDYALSQGVVLVAASGNDGSSRLTYPAAYENVIGVTAIDANDNRAPFANYGTNLDISAPGYQIHALWSDDAFIFFNGTSASSPIVAGLAARILQNDPSATPSEVYSIIQSEADDTGLPGSDLQYGAGIISPERIEAIGETGIYDIALADLYPATEQAEGGSFPLYVSLQNRGTDYIPGATIELSVNGTPYFYRFSGMDSGAVESIQIPVTEASITGPEPFNVTAKVVLPDQYEDDRPNNNEGSISLPVDPEV